MAQILLPEGLAPSTPAANTVALYSKAGGQLYSKDDAGVETQLGGGGSVSSVDITVPTGLSVSGNPITSSGTFVITYTAGYSLPTTTSQTDWDTAFSWGNYATAIGVTIQAYDADTAKTDVAQTFTAAQRASITALTDGATITPDFALNNFFSVTLGGNRTLANPTNLVAGQSGSIFITQDGGGSKTLAYESFWDFAGGVAPTLSTVAGTVDRLDYVVRTTGSIHAVLTQAWS